MTDVMCPLCKSRPLSVHTYYEPEPGYYKQFRTMQGHVRKWIAGSDAHVLGTCSKCKGADTYPVYVPEGYEPPGRAQRRRQ